MLVMRRDRGVIEASRSSIWPMLELEEAIRTEVTLG